MQLKILTYLLIGTVLWSCQSIEEPEITNIEITEVLDVSTKQLSFDGNMIIHNPNPFSLDLANAKIKAMVDGKQLAYIDQVYDTEMPANDDFKMPVHINLDLTKLFEENPLSAIGKGLQLIAERKIKIHFLGDIKVGKGSVKIKVPVDRQFTIDF